MTPPVKRAIVWSLAGGAAFWLPFVALAAAAPNPTVLVVNLCPLAGLVLLGVVVRSGTGGAPSWGWVLAGIYLLGPALQLLPFSLTSPPSWSDWEWVVLVSIFPPMTLWLATLDGVLFAVLIASVGLAWLTYRQWRANAG